MSPERFVKGESERSQEKRMVLRIWWTGVFPGLPAGLPLTARITVFRKRRDCNA
jgi:hypothetical protein